MLSKKEGKGKNKEGELAAQGGAAMEKIERSDLLLVIDVQNDFCPGGALPVPDGRAVVPVINRVIGLFPAAGATQDWHPAGHFSFASSHPGKKPFETIPWHGQEQVLWPDHCLQGSAGADLHPELEARPLRFLLRKGTRRDVDSYSGFLENDHRTSTGLKGLLQELGVRRIFVAGLATDYCVRATVLDGLEAGFRVAVLVDACRGVDVPAGSVKKALEEMRSRGALLLETRDLSAG